MDRIRGWVCHGGNALPETVMCYLPIHCIVFDAFTARVSCGLWWYCERQTTRGTVIQPSLPHLVVTKSTKKNIGACTIDCYSPHSRSMRRQSYLMYPVFVGLWIALVGSTLGERFLPASSNLPSFVVNSQNTSSFHLRAVSTPKSQQPKSGTILNGYGSRTQYASTVTVSKTVVTITSDNREVDHEVLAKSTNAPLFVHHFQGGGKQPELQVFSSINATLCRIRADGGTVRVEEESASNTHSSLDFLNKQWTPVQSLYGVYILPSGHIYVWIVASEPVYEPLSIHRVTEMHMTMVSNSNNNTSSLTKEEDRQLKLLRRSLKDHDWYFCKGSNVLLRDMTRSLQATHRHLQQTSPSIPWTPDESFFWNADLVTPLATAAASSILLQHIQPLTSAYVGVQHQPLYDQVLISRRSKFRAGTRFTKRGIDPTGAVANSVETEQILALQNATMFASHVQTRGSLPLFWSSPTDVKTYRPRVQIGVDPVAQATALLAHLRDYRLRYTLEEKRSDASTSILFVNLIDKKKDQGRLGHAFDSVLKAVLDVHNETLTGIEHEWFDFHAEVKNGQWHKLANLLQSAARALDHQGYFLVDTNTGFVEKQQDGVIRTNCMDCLDRTNVVQGLFARYALFHQLDDLGYIGRLEKEKFKSELTRFPAEHMENTHRLLWADNADAISRLYAGTPALKGDFTRTGKRTKKGALDDGVNSLHRYYKNNFLDADRQEGIDLMTGHRPFSGVEEIDVVAYPTGTPSDSKTEKSEDNLKEVIRKLLLGSDMKQAGSVQATTPLNVKGGATLQKSKWGLRWLPGDLQSQVNQLNSGELEEMNHRAISSKPWWVHYGDTDESESDDSDGE